VPTQTGRVASSDRGERAPGLQIAFLAATSAFIYSGRVGRRLDAIQVKVKHLVHLGVPLSRRVGLRLFFCPGQESPDTILYAGQIERCGTIEVERGHPMQDSPQIVEQKFCPRRITTRAA